MEGLSLGRQIIITILALVMLGGVVAWLNPPTDVEKLYFKDATKNLTEREFSGRGVAIGSEDTALSIYVYKRQTLTAEEWTLVFKDAFATNPKRVDSGL